MSKKEAYPDPAPQGARTAPALIRAEVVPLSRLRPNKGQIPGVPKNPRQIKDAKFRQLKASVQEDPDMMGIREIVAFPHKDTLVIVGGTMRYHALKELGYTETPAKILPPDTTPEKLRRFILKDNSAFGEYDWDAIANEWDTAEVLGCGIDVPEIDSVKTEEEAEDDNFDVEGNIPKKPKARIGDMYALGKHRLICGDSTDMAVIGLICGDTHVDLVLTDPPYNVNYTEKSRNLEAGKSDSHAGKYNIARNDIANDKQTKPQFIDFLTKAFTAMTAALKPGGAFYIWLASMQIDNFVAAVRNAGLEWKQLLIWAKNNFVLGRNDYQWKHEPCLYGWKPGATHYFTDSRNRATVWMEENIPKDKNGDFDFKSATKEKLVELLRKLQDLPSTVIEEQMPLHSGDHPTMKPVKLMGRLIKNSTRQGETVLDPFGGSGSTLIAAEQLGRVCYMVELEPCYIDVIVKRWEEYTQQEAVYLGNSATEGGEA